MKRSLGRRLVATPSVVWIVGTFDRNDRPNLMAAAWAGICCSRPPCLAVSLREATYSYQAILDRQAFSVNIPTAEQAEVADYLGLASGRDVDKIAACGLTATPSEHVDAPLVEEFPMSFSCALIHTLKIGLHTLFVGEIRDVQADDVILNEADRPILSMLNPLLFSAGEQRYYATGDAIGPAFEMGKKFLDDIDPLS